MYSSLNKIKALPESTLCYPAHEYTANNLRFITSLDSNHAYYQDYAKYLLMKLNSFRISDDHNSITNNKSLFVIRKCG